MKEKKQKTSSEQNPIGQIEGGLRVVINIGNYQSITINASCSTSRQLTEEEEVRAKKIMSQMIRLSDEAITIKLKKYIPNFTMSTLTEKKKNG